LSAIVAAAAKEEEEGREWRTAAAAMGRGARASAAMTAARRRGQLLRGRMVFVVVAVELGGMGRGECRGVIARECVLQPLRKVSIVCTRRQLHARAP